MHGKLILTLATFYLASHAAPTATPGTYDISVATIDRPSALHNAVAAFLKRAPVIEAFPDLSARGVEGEDGDELENRGQRTGYKSRQVKERGQRTGYKAREVEERGQRTGYKPREVEERGQRTGYKSREVEERGQRTGYKSREVEERGQRTGY